MPMLLVLWVGVLIAGCGAVPTTTRTGIVVDVTIADQVDPPAVALHRGDEVLFINERTTPVRIRFPFSRSIRLSCRRGFHHELKSVEAAEIGPGQSASLCFDRSGEYDYAVDVGGTADGSPFDQTPDDSVRYAVVVWEEGR